MRSLYGINLQLVRTITFSKESLCFLQSWMNSSIKSSSSSSVKPCPLNANLFRNWVLPGSSPVICYIPLKYKSIDKENEEYLQKYRFYLKVLYNAIKTYLFTLLFIPRGYEYISIPFVCKSFGNRESNSTIWARDHGYLSNEKYILGNLEFRYF